MTQRFIVQRKNVYVGQLMICPVDEKSLESDTDEVNLRYKPNVLKGIIARSMLLERKDNNQMEDLIYTTPMPYEMVDDCWQMKEPYGIVNAVPLNDLLEYLKFTDELTREDINKIFMVFVKHQNWVKRNCRLFGLKKFGNNYFKTEDGQFSEKMFVDLLMSSYINQTKPHNQEPFYKVIKKQK